MSELIGYAQCRRYDDAMVDFAARIAEQQERERRQEEGAQVLRLELDRQLIDLGRSLIEFRTAHGTAQWTEVWTAEPELTVRDGAPLFAGASFAAMAVWPRYQAYVMDDGRWVVAEYHIHSHHELGPGPTQNPNELTYLLLKGCLSSQFQLREHWGLSGAIREHFGLNDPSYQYLTCRRRGWWAPPSGRFASASKPCLRRCCGERLNDERPGGSFVHRSCSP